MLAQIGEGITMYEFGRPLSNTYSNLNLVAGECGISVAYMIEMDHGLARIHRVGATPKYTK